MNAKSNNHKTSQVESENRNSADAPKTSHFSNQIGIKTARKLRAQRNQAPGIWFGLGIMGIIGWSVVIPTLLGTALGLYLDEHYNDQHSWTLALLIAGLTLGCFNAWYWVDKEDQAMRNEQEQEDNDE
jgi:ATP synthase protein I